MLAEDDYDEELQQHNMCRNYTYLGGALSCLSLTANSASISSSGTQAEIHILVAFLQMFAVYIVTSQHAKRFASPFKSKSYFK